MAGYKRITAEWITSLIQTLHNKKHTSKPIAQHFEDTCHAAWCFQTERHPVLTHQGFGEMLKRPSVITEAPLFCLIIQ